MILAARLRCLRRSFLRHRSHARACRWSRRAAATCAESICARTAAARAWARDGARVHAEAPLAPNGTPHVRLLRGLPAMAPGSHPLSEDQMRRTWALVDILTSLKRRANHPPPTAELICRKFDALSLPALDTLSIVVDHAIAEQGRRLSPRQVCGMARAVRSFPEDTAAEVAYAHACGKVVSDATVEAARGARRRRSRRARPPSRCGGGSGGRRGR